MNRDAIKIKLQSLPVNKLRWFIARCVLRIFPLIAFTGNKYSFWGKESSKHLFSIFRATNAALYASLKVAKTDSNIKNAADLAAEDVGKALSTLNTVTYLTVRTVALAARSAVTYGKIIDDAADVAFTAANAIVLSNSSEAREAIYGTLDEIYTADINLLKKTTRGMEPWTNLRSGMILDFFSIREKAFCEGLIKMGFDYWENEYNNWIRGKFDYLKMERCLLMSKPTIQAGYKAMFTYLNSDLVHMAEARVVFLGDGEAGKTSLIRKLHGEEIRGDEPATPRVEILRRQERIGDQDVWAHY
jgi:hypothetical protein